MGPGVNPTPAGFDRALVGGYSSPVSPPAAGTGSSCSFPSHAHSCATGNTSTAPELARWRHRRTSSAPTRRNLPSARLPTTERLLAHLLCYRELVQLSNDGTRASRESALGHGGHGGATSSAMTLPSIKHGSGKTKDNGSDRSSPRASSARKPNRGRSGEVRSAA